MAEGIRDLTRFVGEILAEVPNRKWDKELDGPIEQADDTTITRRLGIVFDRAEGRTVIATSEASLDHVYSLGDTLNGETIAAIKGIDGGACRFWAFTPGEIQRYTEQNAGKVTIHELIKAAVATAA